MKTRILIVLSILSLTGISTAFSQSVSINTTGNAADTSAILDITSANKGILIPRMTSTQKLAIYQPADGLLVYQTDGVAGFYFYNSSISTWKLLAGVTGSAGITSLNGLTDADQTFASPGTIGSAPNWISGNAKHTLNIPLASATGVSAGLLSNADWNTFNNKQSALTKGDIASTDLSVTGGNGAVIGTGVTLDLKTLNANTVSYGSNNGTSYPIITVDTKGRVVSATTANISFPSALIKLNTLTSGTQTLAIGTSGAAPTWLSSGSTHTLNLPLASTSGVTAGLLSNADWNSFKTSTADKWSLTGNAGTNSATNFLGTTDNVSIRFKSFNTQGIILDSLGNVGVGSAPIFTVGAAREKFLVDAGSSANPTTTGAFNIISGKGYLDSYLQLNVQNRAATALASSDIVASNDAATEAANFIDMGINSSGNTSTGVLGGINTGYLYSTGNDFAIGNASANRSLNFFTGGTSATNERMRIDGSGNVGIGTQTPEYKLQVSATANPLSLLGVQIGTNTTADSLLTISGGIVKKLPAATFASATNAIASLNGITTTTQTFAAPGTTGLAPSWSSTGSAHTLNIPLASASGVTAGLLSNADWTSFKTSTSDKWSLTGNAGTSSGTNFLGTTDNVSLRLQSFNTQGIILDSLGNVGIGSSPTFTSGAAREKFLVDAGSSTNPTPGGAFNIISGKGFLDSYLQLNVQNRAATALASSDIVASNDAATEAVNFIDLGINSSGNTSTGVLGGNNTGYLYSTGSDFAVGNASVNRSLNFFTGGILATNERMRIDGSGNVGIGTQTPAYKLQVSAGANPLSLLGVQVGTNTTADSLLTISGGIVKKLPAATFASATNAIATLNGLTATTQNFAIPGTNGSAPAWSSTGSAHTLNIPLASASGVTAGLLSNSDWSSFKTSTSDKWYLTGNAGTNSGTNFLGTTDNVSLRFQTYNKQGIVLDSLGNVAVGVAPTFTPLSGREKFLVDAGTTTSINAISAKGIIDNYFQLNIQNKSASSQASSDIVATSDNGDESGGFVDLGINSSAYTAAAYNIGGFNDSYLYSTATAGGIGGNMSIGTGSSGKVIKFHTGGTTSANERMRIDGLGNVGIGTSNPTNKLQISSTANPLSLLGVQTGTNTDSILTITGGVVRKLSPSALTTSSSNAWALVGNSGSATTKLGTTSAFDLPIITNNTTRMTVAANGNIGIGSTGFDATNPEKLLVDAGATNSSTLLNATGDKNGYLQLNVQNTANGNFSSSDIVATANNGTENSMYIDMGVNSQGYQSGNNSLLNGSNTAYLYASASDFYIGNGAVNKPLIFFTNNTGSLGDANPNGTEKMRITGTGEVLIGTTTINGSNKLTVNGSVSASAFNVNSDRRLKTNIQNLPYGLKDILALKPVKYNWKSTPTTNKQIGLIAQDAKKVIPEVVSGNEQTGKLSINYTELIPILINAIKEQQKEIEDLKETVKKLQK